MRRLAILFFAASCGTPAGPTSAAGSALDLYRAGEFEKCEQTLARTLARDPRDVLALRLLGRIQLYRNRLKESVETLRRALRAMEAQAKDNPRRAVELRADWQLTCQDYATACYRMDDYAAAAEAYALLGEGLLATKYSALAKEIPYVARWDDEPSVVPFEGRDPIPTVRLRVNGAPGLFAIDTGSGEVVLDPRFAKKAGAKSVGLRMESFTGEVGEGSVEAVTIGSLTVRNVPVRMRRLERLGRDEVDGLLGAAFLIHFAFTIDYRKERLVLRRGTAEVPRAGTEIPFLAVGDRFLVVPGEVDGRGCLLLVNTGLSRVAVAPSQGLVWTLSNGEPQNYRVTSAKFGPVSLARPSFDTAPFPAGLDTNFGFAIAAALGHEAFAGRALTFEPDRMKVTIE